MNKFTKKDWINILILTSLFLVFVFALVKTDFLYGSKLDWNDQITAIADYFRLQFYETKDLFPDFAFNLGAGQNIYNFSYYGLLSPYIFISYLFPFLNMTYYLIIISILTVIISTILLYKWLKNKKLDTKIIFFSSLIFMFSTGLSFHSHRHIMFMLYMPYLILALMGVDKYFKENKKSLLILSTFLVIASNYYFSIGGLLTIVIYGIYKYIEKNKKITIKDFFIEGTKFLIPIIIGVIMSLVILLPTIYVILNNRSDTSVTINLLEILIPKINTDYLLYNHYGIGLTALSFISLVYSLLSSKKENFTLGVILFLIIIFPLFIYILNGAMYLDSKVLIPMLPLYVFLISLFLKDLIAKKIDIKRFIVLSTIVIILCIFSTNTIRYQSMIDSVITLLLILIYLKFNKPFILYSVLTIIIIGGSYGVNRIDNFISKEDYIGNNYQNELTLINKLNEDKDFYRTTNLLPHNLNRVFTYDTYIPTIYSSTSNLEYNKFYFDTINNPIKNRNRTMTSANNNLISNIFLGNKYLIDKKDINLLGYTEYLTEGNVSVYQNNSVFPIGYAMKNTMDEKDFNKLSYPYTSIALLNSIITKKDTNYELESVVEVIETNIENYLNDIDYQKEGEKYNFKLGKDYKITVPLDEKYANKLLIIEFDANYSQDCKNGDTDIYINGIRNALTCSSWKYHNGNYNFVYQVGITDDLELNIKISKGQHSISNLKVYSIDANYFENLISNLDELIFDKDKTKGDYIVGDIVVKESGYFTLSIPYDKGFNIKVDGKNLEYEKVNTAFIGFEIEEGNHHIEIEYKAPLKKEGLIASSLGFVAFLGIFTFEITSKRRLKK